MSRIFILSSVLVLLSLAGSAFAEIGTMDNPIPIGQAVNLSNGWQLKVLSVVPNANNIIRNEPNADNIIRNENGVNSPPKDGYQFFLARLEIKNIGSDAAQFNDFDLNVVGASLIAYGHEIGRTIPDPILTNDVFPGGVLTGNTLWEIKSSDASSLVMYHKNVKPYIFFSLTQQNKWMWKHGESVQAYDKGPKLDPTWENPWVNEGETLRITGKCNEPIKVHDEAIKINPKFGRVWFGKMKSTLLPGKLR